MLFLGSQEFARKKTIGDSQTWRIFGTIEEIADALCNTGDVATLLETIALSDTTATIRVEFWAIQNTELVQSFKRSKATSRESL